MKPAVDLSVLEQRTRSLAELFGEIARTRMRGVPLLHPGLWVEAVGFAPCPRDPGADPAAPEAPAVAAGILITPWFMNLLCLPLARIDAAERVGVARRHAIGARSFAFIAAHEARVGSFEACSLFSPMFEFADQAAARATARNVLATLREVPPVAPAPARACAPAAPAAAPRRAFLFGRGAGDAALR